MVVLAFVVIIDPASAAGAVTVTAITPSSGINTTTVSITDLTGTNFQSNATVLLTPVNVNPVHKGSIVDGGGAAPYLNSPQGVFVSGSYAYVTSQGSNALEIVDVTDPANPIHKGSIVDGGGAAPFLNSPYNVFVSGNYAYIASAGNNALEIVDVTDPAHPVHSGSLQDGGGNLTPCLGIPHSVFVSGNITFVASTGDDALEIVNVTDPANPLHLNRLDDASGVAPYLNGSHSVYVYGNYAYVVSLSSHSLEIVNVTDPAHPGHKGSILDGGGVAPYLNTPYSVFISDSFAYIAGSGSNALEIIDVGTVRATNVSIVSPTKITCAFNLSGKDDGLYNVVVSNSDGQFGTLAGGFTIAGSTLTPLPTPIPTPTSTQIPTLTPPPTIPPTPTSTPVPVYYGGGGSTDSDLTPVPTRLARTMVTVNVGGDSSVYRAHVTGTGISDLIITGTVHQVSGQGMLPADTTVYEYIDLVPARYATIEQVVMFFTVRQSWLDENNLIPKNILLYHRSNSSWTALPTTLVKTENGRQYFTAQSPAFSQIAIAGTTAGVPGTLFPTQEPEFQPTVATIKASFTARESIAGHTPTPVQMPEVQQNTHTSSGSATMLLFIGIAGVIIAIFVLAVRKRRL
jgi:hypothetical protein